MLTRSREELLIFLLALVNFTNIIDFMVLMPLGPQINRVFHLGPQSWSLLVASYSLAAAFSGVASVFYIDKIDRKKMLLLSYIGFTVATLICGPNGIKTIKSMIFVKLTKPKRKMSNSSRERVSIILILRQRY